MGQRATEETLRGERGIAMIAEACAQMKHIWRPEGGATDFGVDGHIELRDPGTGEVRNHRIAVQSRATKNRWAGETDSGFFYTASERHLRYWLSGTQPVLLICSRPETGEIYARSIQEWASDPEARATRRVSFDKGRDRFDVGFREKLFSLKAQPDDRVEPPTPAREPETVTTNLMPLTWQVDRLYSADVPHSNASELFEPAHAARVHDFSSVLRDGMVWSLGPFRKGFTEAIGASNVKSSPLAMWLDSGEAQDANLIRSLARRSLISQHSRWIRWHGEKHVAFFRLQDEPDEWRPVTFKWSRGNGRTVVSPRASTTHEGYSGYRHDAAELSIRRIGDGWFVQVRPTYVFTWDGHQVSGHHDLALAGIKKTEGHASVSQALRMWEHLLVEKFTLERRPAALTLQRLVTLTSPRSIQDRAWRRVTAKDLGRSDPGHMTLFDPDGSGEQWT